MPRGSVYVLGDCADVSVDSRVWGPLRTSEIRARPLNTPREEGGAKLGV